ncbi:hypothetical protein OUZ56_018607 [Daphnia magna]|uniref:Uncharacterized protein n=1 Tax=Daphnia magna TaxID=35525 RepID=A0ABQ9Z9F2_9CRUS|nr:hypothetical protein OUZ56_018607 [Daphnia magna]
MIHRGFASRATNPTYKTHTFLNIETVEEATRVLYDAAASISQDHETEVSYEGTGSIFDDLDRSIAVNQFHFVMMENVTKTVIVEIDGNEEFEVEFQSGGFNCDLQGILKCMKSKSNRVKRSEKFPGKWVIVGDFSPVKDMCNLQCTVKPSRSKVHFNDSTYNNVNIEDPLKETCVVEDNWEEFTTEENTSLSMSASISRMNNDSRFECVCIEKEGQIQVVETSVSKIPSTFVILEEADGNLQSHVLPTHVPDKRNQVSKLFDTYGEAIMVDPNNEDVPVLRFRRKRLKAGVKLSGKGGRPRRQLTYIYNPGVLGQEEEVDMVSYWANVQVLIEQHKTSGNAIALKTLTDLTFSGRRREIITGMFTNVMDIVKMRCPVLNQASHLCDEMDRILSVNCCMRIRESSMAIVPKIITLAKSSTSASRDEARAKRGKQGIWVGKKLSGTKSEQSEENRGFGWKLSGTKAEQSEENRKFGWVY